jgi:peptidoglycan/LPS O-acetylase OafA/YrhL
MGGSAALDRGDSHCLVPIPPFASSTGEPPSLRPEIEGLRALSVIAVVAYHAGVPGLGGGFIGVDAFFVISGYVITAQLARARGAPLRGALASFYARRARRLLPALSVMLLAVGVAGLLLFTVAEIQALGKSGLTTALFAANVYFWRRGDDYFARAAEEHPLLHTWSLAVEEQFYLCWPLLLLAWWRFTRRPASGDRWLVRGIGAATVCSLAAFIACAEALPAATFFLTPFRAWELGVGVLLSLSGDDSRPSRRVALALGAGGLALLALGASSPVAAASSTLPVVCAVGGAALIVRGGAGASAWPFRLLSSPFMQLTGKLSYAWYLWHWPLIVMARIIALNERSLARDGAIAIVAYGVAYLSTRFVEQPIRALRVGGWAGVRGTIARGAALALGLAAFYAVMWKWGEATFHATLAPASIGCLHLTAGEQARAASPCTLAEGAEGTVFLLGDSHADHWSPAVAAWANAAGVSALERARSSCPVPLGAYAGAGWLKLSPECVAYSRAVLAEVVESAARGRTGVVLSVHWGAYSPSDVAADASGVARAAREVASLFHRAGARVLVVGPTPDFPFDPPACVARRAPASCRVAREDVDALSEPFARALRSLALAAPSVAFWDGASIACDREGCSPLRDGVLAFRDDGHLSREGAELAGPALVPDLDWLVAAPR